MSDNGGLGRRPNDSRVEAVRFWSDRQARSVRISGGREVVGDSRVGAEPFSKEGDAGRRSWKGSFILRTDRKGEIEVVPRSAERLGCDTVYSDCSARGDVDRMKEREFCGCCLFHG